MLYTITLLTTLLLAVFYPLCFWISARDPLKQGFHHFHSGLPLVLSGVLTTYITLKDFPHPIVAYSLLWTAALTVIVFYYWKKEAPSALLMSVPVLLGMHVYVLLQNYLIGFSEARLFIGFLSGLIFCATLFAMNLGHWYLNVHGLPLGHLKRATQAIGVLLVIRLCWDAAALISTTIVHQGIPISLVAFMATVDGILILVGIFFGTLFPLISLFFVQGTLQVKNTQSATGILYVTLCSVLLGDMAYKYYLIKFNVCL